MIKVTGGNYYGMQGHTNNKTSNQLKTGTFEGFFRKDTFSKTASRVIEVNNYYTAKTTGKKAPYPSSNCYVEDVEGAQAALDKLKSEADSFDYTGMSDGEIFMSIFNRYSDYFGDDFLNYNWQQHIVDKSGIDKTNKNMAGRIRDQFSSEMNSHVENRQEAYKYYYGYEGMTDEEMRMEIYAEFAVSGTYANFYKMVDKLYCTGLISQEEHCALRDVIDSVQAFTKQPPLSIMLYEKYGHLLGGYEENMDIDELLKIFEEVEKNTTWGGNEEMIKVSKAAIEEAKQILSKLKEMGVNLR